MEKLFRTVVAVMMALAVVTPTFAEAGCLEDNLPHVQAPGHAQDQIKSCSDDADEGAPAKPVHCAFSHGAHGFGIPASTAFDLDSHVDREAHLRAQVRPLTPVSPDGPYHPPQA